MMSSQKLEFNCKGYMASRPLPPWSWLSISICWNPLRSASSQQTYSNSHTTQHKTTNIIFHALCAHFLHGVLFCALTCGRMTIRRLISTELQRFPIQNRQHKANTTTNQLRIHAICARGILYGI
eukprot:COSAG05_NODE_180_length_14817_cov_423.925262_4_plen_124_part_00